jgi:hypothetical protein
VLVAVAAVVEAGDAEETADFDDGDVKVFAFILDDYSIWLY